MMETIHNDESGVWEEVGCWERTVDKPCEARFYTGGLQEMASSMEYSELFAITMSIRELLYLESRLEYWRMPAAGVSKV
jgi:hypothetical protein